MLFSKSFLLTAFFLFTALARADFDAVYQNLTPEEGLVGGAKVDLVLIESDTYEEGFEAFKETLKNNKDLPDFSQINPNEIRFLGLHPRSDRKGVEQVLNKNGISIKGNNQFLLSLEEEKNKNTDTSPKRNPSQLVDDYVTSAPSSDKLKSLKEKISVLKPMLDNLSKEDRKINHDLGKKIWGVIEKKKHYKYWFTGIRTVAVAGGATLTMWSASAYKHVTLIAMSAGSGLMSGLITWNGKRIFQLLSEHRVKEEFMTSSENLFIQFKNGIRSLIGKKEKIPLIKLNLQVDEDGNVIRSTEAEFFKKWSLLETSVNVVNASKDRLLVEKIFENEKIWDGTKYILPGSLSFLHLIKEIAILTPFTVATQGFTEKIIESLLIRTHEYYLAAAAYYTTELQSLEAGSEKYVEYLELRNASLYLAKQKYVQYNLGLIAGSIAWIMSSAIQSPEFYIHYSPLLVLAGTAGVVNQFYVAHDVIGKKGLKTSEMVVSAVKGGMQILKNGVDKLKKISCIMDYMPSKKRDDEEVTP